MSNTATVETLTAEVHVLMVSNRQVTLSVARQLDSYDLAFGDEPGAFTPFGRVRTGAKGTIDTACGRKDRGAYEVAAGRYARDVEREFDFEWIGRHDPTGALCTVHCYQA